MSEDHESHPLGQIIDSLGVELIHHDGDLISDIVIVAKVVDADGGVRLGLGWSEGMSWIERIGMLSIALRSEQKGSDE